MDLPVTNLDELRAEISRLRGLEQEQAAAISKRFGSPSAVFSTIFSLFPKKSSSTGEKTPGLFDQDFVALIARFVVPFTLNRTLFRHSNFLVKALVGLISQKAAHFITEDSLVSLWETVKSLFKNKSDDIPEHRAIPALSETY
jgi:hypothetical protein